MHWWVPVQTLPESILAPTSVQCINAAGRPPGGLSGQAVGEGRRGATSDFWTRVYAVVRRIPEGKVTTYGRVAHALGAPRSARMVGWALNGLPPGSDVPAHRVVNRNGRLTGAHHFGPPEVMRGLLEDEGVRFVDDLTVDLSAHLWDPADDPEVDALFVMPD